MDNERKKNQILIVDDVPLNMRIVSNFLHDEGYNLDFANNGKEAIQKINEKHYDLILLDIRMPEMDGFEVCRIAKRNNKTKFIPIIFLTADVDTESLLTAFEVGAVDYVTKPFNGVELLARVKTHLELSKYREELKKKNKQLRKNEEKYRYLAIHDDLTKLYNTRYLYEKLQELITQSKASNRPFSLIFMDIDNFKHVVDTYGHLNGSQAIHEVAKTIKSCLNNPCFGVAYGGDEFVVVLPGYNKDKSIQKADEIRCKMRETKYLSDKGFLISLTASFGISTYPDNGTDMIKLLGQADKAMFDVKEKGKDAISIADSDSIQRRNECEL